MSVINPKDIPNLFIDKINTILNKKVNDRLDKISDRVFQLQKTFFSTMVESSGVFGAMSSPIFEGLDIQPVFDDLSQKYSDRKNNHLPIPYFFIFTGGLKDILAKEDALQLFGKPIIFIEQYNYKGQRQQIQFTTNSNYNIDYFDKNNKTPSNYIQPRTKLATISINLFPNVTTNLSDKNTFDYLKYFSYKVAYQLFNREVGSNRRFLNYYMLWWIKVKAKEVLKGL